MTDRLARTRDLFRGFRIKGLALLSFFFRLDKSLAESSDVRQQKDCGHHTY